MANNNRSNWKGRERLVAAFFGVRRTPLSGQNSGHTSADIIHDTLFVEHKHRAAHAIVSLFKKTRELAKKEGKIPVVTLSVKHDNGFYVMCHSSDLQAVANQRAKARTK